jgi:hypothetical protein
MRVILRCGMMNVDFSRMRGLRGNEEDLRRAGWDARSEVILCDTP